MQQLFTVPAAEDAALELYHFELPSEVRPSLAAQLHAAPHNLDDTHHVGDRVVCSSGEQPSAERRACELAALRQLIEYGDEPHSAVTRLTRQLASAHGTRHNAVVKVTEVARGQEELRVCRLMLRRALALLCRVVALDKSGVFVFAAPSANGSEATSGPIRHTFLELYCLLQGLELEVEDAATAAATTSQQHGVADARVEAPPSWRRQLAHRVHCCVDALEATVIDVLLATPVTPAGQLVASLSYVSELLAALPHVFREEQWPCRLLLSSGTTSTRQDAATTAIVVAGSVLGRRTSDTSSPLHDLLHSYLPSDAGQEEEERANMPDKTAMLASIGQATTSIMLQALLSMAEADCCDVLGRQASPSLTSLAAAQHHARLSAFGAAVPPPSPDMVHLHQPREPLELGALTFMALLAEAWSGVFAMHGLRRGLLKVRALFYRLRYDAHAAQTTSKATATRLGGTQARSTPAAATAIARMTANEKLEWLRRLWAVWQDAVRAHYSAVLQQMASAVVSGTTSASSCQPDSKCDVVLDELDLAEASVFALEAAPAQLTSVQQAALRVLEQLRALDGKGWFAIPAFDLVNLDFASIAVYVRSPCFARKSAREAFNALRGALERMVDSCVLRYGPTHEFSVVITSVRQELVSAARREALL